MKRNTVTSYLGSVAHYQDGETYSRIFGYFLPEYFTALIVYSLPLWLDSYFIGSLESMNNYIALSSANNLLHFIIKVAEAFSIGTVILAGNYNGRDDAHGAGSVLQDSVLLTCIMGFVFSGAIFFGAEWIYKWYGIPHDILSDAIPFLRVRAIGIFFMFISLALIGFLRGIKNTQTPMKLFLFGVGVFVFFDYLLIFGKCGFPALGLMGSAVASIIQYASVFFVALCYLIVGKKYRKYAIGLLKHGRPSNIKRLLFVSWPIILDKATMAGAYLWLGKVIAPLGACCCAAFGVIKDMERFAFLPAIACAQVITFLVSNDVSAGNIAAAKSNIKKIIITAFIMVFVGLLILGLFPEYCVALFDRKGEFSELAVRAFPFVSVLVVCDLLQLILAGGLRGSGDVKTVMIIRLVVCLCFFVPVSYFISSMSITSDLIKFILIYGSFYVGNGLMSIAYMYRFSGKNWNKITQ